MNFINKKEYSWVLRFRSKLTQHTYIRIGVGLRSKLASTSCILAVVIQICVALSSVEVFPTHLKATAKDGGVRIETGSEIETTTSMAFYFGRATAFKQDFDP